MRVSVSALQKCFACFLWLWAPLVFASSPSLQAGLLDLRQWNAGEQKLISLRGEWEFYWSKLYEPHDLVTPVESGKTLIQVPGSWNLKGYPLYGYATYRLRVVLQEPLTLAIRLPWIQAASRIYIDDVLVEEIGKVNSREDDFTQQVKEDYWIFTPRTAAFDIIIQAANHYSLMGGLAGTPTIGTAQAIKATYIRDIALAIFIVGCLFVMGIYHFCLYAFRTKAPSTLYFGMVCVFMSTFAFTSHLPSMTTFFPAMGNINATRFYLVWTLVPAPLAYFFHELFPHRFPRLLAHLLTVFYAVMYLAIWTFEFKRIAPPLFLYQFVTASMGLYLFFAIIQAVRHKEDGARLLLLGVVILVGTGIHDMLRFLYDSPNLTGFGLLAFIFCQSALLARRFSHAFAQVEASEMEIRQLSDDLKIQHGRVVAMNENLEHLVDEKTRDIRSIMSHIQLGIFAIMSDQCKVHRDYSLHLKEIFEKDELADLNACDLIFDSCSLNSDEKSQATSAIYAALGEDELAFQANAFCLPAEMKRTARDGQERILELSWNAIIDDSHRVDKILVTVKDVTVLRGFQEEANDRKEELEFIGELVNVSPEIFKRFMQNCYDLLSENRKLLNSRSIQSKDMEVLKVMFINMHTMKGSARSLYFKRMTKIFHDVEQYYSQLQKNPQAEWNLEKMKNDLDEVEKIIEMYESVNRNKLGRKISDENTVEMSEHQLLRLYRNTQGLEELATGTNQAAAMNPLLHDMQALMFPYIFVSVKTVLTDICLCLKILAKDLEKAMPVLLIEGDELHINSQGEQLLRKIFVHILRNSMDHGIEEPRERVRKGKTPEGHISISLQKKVNFVHIYYRDDGKGLDLEKIHQTAKSQGLVDSSAPLSLQEKADLIFQSGLSTAVQVNDISGRGVGMDAVRRFLQQNEGVIKIHFLNQDHSLQDFHPFYFELILPGSRFADRKLSLVERAA